MKLKSAVLAQHVFLPALCTALGAATLAAVLFVQASREADHVRRHTESIAQQALVRAGHGWARFQIDDDQGRLLGQAPDAARREAALQTLRTAMAPAMAYPGVFRTLADGSQLAAMPVIARVRPRLAPLVDLAARCTEQVGAALGGRRILFETGSSRLTADSRQLLAGVAQAVRDCPAARLSVLGHTDVTGLPALNQRLSQARAEAVAAALIAAGVPAAKLVATGLGASRPLAQGDNAAAHAQNRRIEFHWTMESGAAAAA
jgi:outer membrane protein OmpA-like peptidoglycan-associated protein